MTPENTGSTPSSETNEDRRKFLASCGKFAVVTPPAITMLLSTSLNSTAVAHSGGHGGGRGRDWWDWFDRWDDKPHKWHDWRR
jgi:hypothetical protein